jgi:hypothetical protein
MPVVAALSRGGNMMGCGRASRGNFCTTPLPRARAFLARFYAPDRQA